MRFASTGCRAPAVDLRTALLQALAPDDGLYMPAQLVAFGEDEVRALRAAPLQEIGRVVMRHLIGDEVPDAALRRIVDEALDFSIPLVRLDERLYVLELFHGPTLAFKDIGVRIMARLVAHYRSQNERVLTVLVATSGDTGGAVAHAFHGMPGIRVVILFPRGRVSARQERQFTTLGENVTALGVNGSFDDCQRLVKAMLADDALRREIALTSANSINVGRLLPQIVYYFHAWAQLPDSVGAAAFATPSGNFGNLAAGLMAKRLGLPAGRFIAATNVNRVVPDYLETGIFTPGPSVTTISGAMDVGNPSNLARILMLYDGDLERLRRDLVGSWHTDDETRAGIAQVYGQYGYVLDPHSAVGYLALHRELGRREGEVGILLATAHPAKFAEMVESAIGDSVPIPDRLAAYQERESRVTPLEPRADALRSVLLER